jgi:hypothetical protein
VKENNIELHAESALLKRTVADLNAQVVVLTNRIVALEAGDPTESMMTALGLESVKPPGGAA